VVAVAVTARDEVLGRIAAALRDVPADERPEDVEVPRDYRRSEPDGAVDRFVERLADYGTEVRRVAAADVAQTVGEICGGMRLACRRRGFRRGSTSCRRRRSTWRRSTRSAAL
jgi:L-lactate dehydrogenase complex protein LldG